MYVCAGIGLAVALYLVAPGLAPFVLAGVAIGALMEIASALREYLAKEWRSAALTVKRVKKDPEA